jgi:hypothetical protein
MTDCFRKKKKKINTMVSNALLGNKLNPSGEKIAGQMNRKKTKPTITRSTLDGNNDPTNVHNRFKNTRTELSERGINRVRVTIFFLPPFNSLTWASYLPTLELNPTFL